VPVEQAASAALIVAALAPLDIVDPHCVRVGGVQGFAVVSPSGSVAGSPAFVHVPALLVARMFDHDWPKHGTEKRMSRNKRRILFYNHHNRSAVV
jgi:hypothetical protein